MERIVPYIMENWNQFFTIPPQKMCFFPQFFWGKNVADRRQNLALSLESTL